MRLHILRSHVQRRIAAYLLLATLAIFGAGCHKNKAGNPIATLDSKQPDKVLFDKAMDALKHNKYDVARLTLQTMINAYPDSEYIARAKLGVADSWYQEGGTTAYAQAEVEYKDFQTFFPNMPEAAEAQLKVAGIHYSQMEKADRDFTHAKRAEDEYRQLIQQYPDSKLVPDAKQKLRQVQEVLADREFRIGRFYYLRQAWPAAVARLKSLSDTYPLYSQADEVLYMLGQTYEGEIEMLRAQKASEVVKSKMIAEFTKSAAAAYSRVITRYPAMERADDARSRLEALHQPVPKPTPEALAQNKAEEASRGSSGRMTKVMSVVHRHPDMAQAAAVGEPTLQDPQPTNAPEFVKDVNRMAVEAAGGGKVAVETVKGTPAPNQPTPRSDAGTAASGAAASGGVIGSGSAAAPAATSAPRVTAAPTTTPGDPSIGTLVPNTANTNATPTQPAATSVPPETTEKSAAPPTTQSNEAATPAQTNTGAPGAPAGDSSSPSATGDNSSSSNATKDADDKTANDQESSSKKKKKKKGLGKLNPF